LPAIARVHVCVYSLIPLLALALALAIALALARVAPCMVLPMKRSVVCYIYGREIQKKSTGLPVGLVNTNWGGKPAAAPQHVLNMHLLAVGVVKMAGGTMRYIYAAA
jgi:hypothetical protein